jgi:hypothetical protein
MQFSRTNSVMLSCLLLIVISGCSRTQNNSSLALQSTAPSNANVAVVTQHENTATTTALVKSEKANLRDKPSRSGAIIKEVEKNDRLTLIEQSAVGPWYNVRENKTGSSGWIHGDVIVLNQVPTEVKPSAPQLATTPTPRPVVPTTSGRSYINVDGVRVPSPVFTDRRPEGATARCRDGSYSFSQHRQGTCSHHGGVAEWL